MTLSWSARSGTRTSGGRESPGMPLRPRGRLLHGIRRAGTPPGETAISGEVIPRKVIKFHVFLADITIREHMANVIGTMKRGRPSGSS
jgi:hypothetical protein